ncbi:ACP S-malonyltransferase [Secundilactobacillus pentosiphilus]|uniref:Malonyl CoA-acyl carrier protein transacylase n=1 Tax=Secundilactobacillus pentosiphilus TaxID=1714682 RepID=A0A1Z5IMC3_9LACO|nr:ACP S-malonyltransferase [Secundilactobacillus pentosiphilus]
MVSKLKVGLLFSGQGAQKTGMGEDLYQQNAAYKAVIDQASQVLDLDLAKLYFDVSATDQLSETQYTQPAIVAMSCALYKVVQQALPDVAAGIGLSLGEYSALAASGFMTMEQALKLVKLRGRLMQQASDAAPSKMVAVMNTPIALIQEACEAAQTTGLVAIANINTPKQVVIGGEVKAVDAAVDYLTSKDVKRMVPLKVSGAFHTPLMKPAQSQLYDALAKVSWTQGSFPVISTTTGTPFKAEALTQTLTQQLVSTTRFTDAIQQLTGQVDAVIELGPGKTLMGFARKTVKGIDYYHIDSIETLHQTMTALRGE